MWEALATDVPARGPISLPICKRLAQIGTDIGHCLSDIGTDIRTRLRAGSAADIPERSLNGLSEGRRFTSQGGGELPKAILW